jgi:ubiquinone/menaquinone biosynthesis C-methylase UbiE
MEKTLFDEWSEDYDDLRNKSFLEKSKKNMVYIVEQFELHRSHFLEIGLGTGEIFEMTNTKFDFSLGTDVSEGMVKRAFSKVQIRKDNNNLFVSDGCNLPLQNNCVDLIICQDVLEHVPYQLQLILEIIRILNVNGIAIITTPNPLWAPVLYVAEKLKLKVKEGQHKFVFLSKLVKKALKKDAEKFQLISNRPFMMLPVKSRLDDTIEPLSNKRFFSIFGFSQM